MSQTAAQSPLLFRPEEVSSEPFPHVIKQGAIEPELFARLKAEFPSDAVFDANETTGGRAGRDLYRGDEAYDDLLQRSPAWRELHGYLNSQRFIDFVLSLFGDSMRRFECYTDPAKARFVDHVEGRDVLAERGRLRRKYEEFKLRHSKPMGVDELFVRMDLAQGGVGYAKPVHCDRPNRLCSMLIYFCDADEIELEGGELLIHEAVEKKPYRDYMRHPRGERTREVARLRAKDNLGLLFLCSNNSYHSVRAVESQASYRNFIYCSITGTGPKIWPVTS